MAKDLRDMSDMVGDLHWMAAKAVEDLIKKDARIVELEDDLKCAHSMLAEVSKAGMALRAELAAIKAQGVVMPERKEFPELMMAEYHEVRGWNACLDEVARLNATPVKQVSVPDERAAFEREDRYIVIKRSDMDRIPNQKVVHSFLGALGELSAHSVRIPQRKFLVIESDWPEYDPAWKLIQDRVQGRPILDAAQAAPAADAGLVEALGYQVLFDAIAAATSVYANGAINISVQAFRAALAAHRAKGVV